MYRTGYGRSWQTWLMGSRSNLCSPASRKSIMSSCPPGISVPEAPAFHVLKDIYLTMHPDNIEKLLADPAARYRLYAGFSGWAPNQLESEFTRDGWYILPADEPTLFRQSTEGLWEELVERAMRRDPKGRS